MSKHAAGPDAPAFPVPDSRDDTPKHRKQDRNPDAKEAGDLAEAS
jgi:hypothetical protein